MSDDGADITDADRIGTDAARFIPLRAADIERETC
jgi:hypothetical protein